MTDARTSEENWRERESRGAKKKKKKKKTKEEKRRKRREEKRRRGSGGEEREREREREREGGKDMSLRQRGVAATVEVGRATTGALASSSSSSSSHAFLLSRDTKSGRSGLAQSHAWPGGVSQASSRKSFFTCMHGVEQPKGVKKLAESILRDVRERERGGRTLGKDFNTDFSKFPKPLPFSLLSHTRSMSTPTRDRDKTGTATATATHGGVKKWNKSSLLTKSINTSVLTQTERDDLLELGFPLEEVATARAAQAAESTNASAGGELKQSLDSSRRQLVHVLYQHWKNNNEGERAAGLEAFSASDLMEEEDGNENAFRWEDEYNFPADTAGLESNMRWETYYEDVCKNTPAEKIQQQIELEGKASAKAAQEYKNAWNEACKRGGANQMAPLNNLVLSWFGPLTEAIRETQKGISKARANPGTNKKCAEPFMCILDAEELSFLTINAALTWTLQKHRKTLDQTNFSMPCSVRKAKIAEFLGRVVETEVGLKLMKERIKSKLLKSKSNHEEEAFKGVAESNASRRNSKKIKRNKELEKYLQNILGKLEFDKPNRMESIVRYLVHCNDKFFDGDLLPTWDTTIQVKVGAKLVDMLTETAMVTHESFEGEEYPAFKFARLGRGRNVDWNGPEIVHIKKQAEFLTCSDEMLKVVENHLEVFSVLHPKYMPMVMPPIPWTSCYSGGYLTHKTFVMRVRGSRLQKEYVKEADALGGTSGHSPLSDHSYRFDQVQELGAFEEDYQMVDESGGHYPYIHGVGEGEIEEAVGSSFSVGYGKKGMGPVYDALNSLGVTPWKINKKVFDVVKEVWEGDQEDLRLLTDLPRRGEKGEFSQPEERFRMSSSKHNLTLGSLSESPYEESVRLAQNRRILRENRENHSQKCDFLYKFQTAKEFMDEESIYFPHNMDFRGRAYPMHPYLNHLGSDLCRSMLKFKEEKPIGDNGLRWFFIHIANLCGANKMSLDAREEYGKDSLDAIMDSARNPVNGSRWWAEAENPYQCLATCFEIAEALDSGNPSTFSSDIPIHQDGSCNGLQHYAALSRDEEGARSVNLLPCDEPFDVYSRVAALVAEAVERHAYDPSSNLHNEALNLLGEVDRKLVKQTVMTSVYGVTFVGARQQIASRLKERGWTDKDKIYKTSKVATQLTMDALDAAFKNAKDTMKWLGDCASIISKSGEPVSWTTPLGLPVVQPYRKKRKFVVITTNQRLILQKSNEDLPVSSLKQRTAFPPNYVHSLDSSHLLMTASECHSRGITFAGVHDSFWTHACSVDEMNEVLRERFISLHEQPLLENLLAEFREGNPKLAFPPVPELGSLKLEQVEDAKYFFS